MTPGFRTADAGQVTDSPGGAAALRDLCPDLVNAIRGRAGTFVVTGAAGTGKSRLAEQTARELRGAGWRVVTGYTAGRDFASLLAMLSTALETPSGPT